MKGFIEITLQGNAYPHIVNVNTIATVWCGNPSTGAASIKLIDKNDYGKEVVLHATENVYTIKAKMEAALKEE